ncbi:glycosyltransferase family 4 protein [Alienimonas sp. DA493]|uniref:glycosyltransferase family 4 protein n=1 Tax=Alienimonas sp. DA493 TaxID=3373605 RepID=UPI003754A01F
MPPDPNSGAAGTVWQMATALRAAGHAVDAFWTDDLRRRIAHGNLHYAVELPYAYRREVRRRLAAADYDVVELNQPHAYLAAADLRRRAWPGVFVNRSHGHEVRVREVSAERLPDPGRRAWPRRAASSLLRRVLDRQWDRVAADSDGVLVSSRLDAEFLRRRYGLPPERVAVVTQGVPQSFLRASPAPPPGGNRGETLGYVGQFTPVKAPDVLAEIASRVAARRPGATFTWVCDAAHHDAARALIAPAVLDRVKLRPWMSQDELVGTLDRCRVFLFPSHFEGFGKAPLEAMARGCCVVASDEGGMRDYIDDGTSGVLCRPGDVAAFAAAAEVLTADPAAATAMSAAARRVAARHTWAQAAGEAVAFYRRLLTAKRGGLGRRRT